MGKVLAFFRFIAFITITLAVTAFLLVGRIFGNHPRYSFMVFSTGIGLIKFCLNIRVTYHGEIPGHKGIIMSNHRSYIDGVLIPSRIPYVVVAKSQVRSWPVVGQACRALKVIFVDRDSMESRRNTRITIKERLAEGLSVLIFPEGTTHMGPDILPFKPGMFNTCAEGGFGIIPAAIEYQNRDMAWIGTDTFVPHFFRAFSHRVVRVSVGFGKTITGTDSQEIRMKTEQWVSNETARFRKEWDENFRTSSPKT